MRRGAVSIVKSACKAHQIEKLTFPGRSRIARDDTCELKSECEFTVQVATVPHPIN